MKLILGTKNKAKISGCKAAIKKLTKVYPDRFRREQTELQLSAAPSGVPDMPLKLIDIQDGARNRALFAYKKYIGATLPQSDTYSIGMEGGVYRLLGHPDMKNTIFLQSWIYIYDGHKGHFGCSAALELPDKITDILFGSNRELAEVIDELSGKTDVRSHNGAFGILTNNLYTRGQAFEEAIINGFTPILNDFYYGEENGTRQENTA